MHFRHAKERRDARHLRFEGFRVGASVAAFFIFASIVPVYNKVVFAGIAGDHGFPFPLSLAFLQLAFCAVALTVANLVGKLMGELALKQRRRAQQRVCAQLQARVRELQASSPSVRKGGPGTELGSKQEKWERAIRRLDRINQSIETRSHDSWICGPHLKFKARAIFPIGFLFGLKYGVTNWGLHLLPLAPHLLLQATDLMWTVLFARLLTREFLTRIEFATCVSSTLGTLLIAVRTHQAMPDSFYSIAINLVSPVLLGLCVTTLRLASVSLLGKHARLGGKTQAMTAIELSAIKLWISAFVVLPFALLFENGAAAMLGIIQPASSPQGLSEEPATAYGAIVAKPALGLAVLGGGVFVLCFQLNMTWLSKMTTAVTVGVIGGLKIFPQWLTALAFQGAIDLSPLNLAGAGVVLASSVVWTYLRADPGLAETTPAYKVNIQRIQRREESMSLMHNAHTSGDAQKKEYGAL